MNDMTARSARSSIQFLIISGALRLLEVVPEPNLEISPTDQALIGVIGMFLLLQLQLRIESRTGKALFLQGDPTEAGPLDDDQLGG